MYNPQNGNKSTVAMALLAAVARIDWNDECVARDTMAVAFFHAQCLIADGC